MELSKQYLKLPQAARIALRKLIGDKNFIAFNDKILFKFINESIDTQKTIKSKGVRRAIFRGLLRNHLNYTEDMMKPIEATDDFKQAYHDSGVATLRNQHESKLNLDILTKILFHPVLYLLCMSGLRVDELLSNEYKFIGNTIQVKLNKKVSSEFYPIHIIGSFAKWKRNFIKIRKLIIKTPAINIVNKYNVILKDIIPTSFYKRSTHICRGIYILLIKNLIESEMTMPNLIEKYLHHESATPSVHYQNLIFDKKYQKKILIGLIAKSSI